MFRSSMSGSSPKRTRVVYGSPFSWLGTSVCPPPWGRMFAPLRGDKYKTVLPCGDKCKHPPFCGVAPLFPQGGGKCESSFAGVKVKQSLSRGQVSAPLRGSKVNSPVGRDKFWVLLCEGQAQVPHGTSTAPLWSMHPYGLRSSFRRGDPLLCHQLAWPWWCDASLVQVSSLKPVLALLK